MGSVAAMRTKLRMLKSVPSSSPFPIGRAPAAMQMPATTRAVVRARVPTFFCSSLIPVVSVFITGLVFRFFGVAGSGHLQDLAVNHVGSPDNPQKDENGDEHPFGAEPGIKGFSNEKTKKNAAGHREAKLQYDREVFDPGLVFLVVETHAVDSGILFTC
jgi:hypothetical protein